MPSLLPVLIHDSDLPPAARAALQSASATPDPVVKEAAKRRAASALIGLYDSQLDGDRLAVRAARPARLRSQPAPLLLTPARGAGVGNGEAGPPQEQTAQPRTGPQHPGPDGGRRRLHAGGDFAVRAPLERVHLEGLAQPGRQQRQAGEDVLLFETAPQGRLLLGRRLQGGEMRPRPGARFSS